MTWFSRHKTIGFFVLFFLAVTVFGVEIQHPRSARAMSAPVTTDQDDFVFEEPNLPQPQDSVLLQDNKTGYTPQGRPGIQRPRVAIIIDDMGYHEHIGNRLLAFPLDLTFSFLPQAPFSLQQEETAFRQGRDILIHLPMEAQDPTWNLGPGALYLSQSPAELIATMRENISSIPHAIGANNHMGSRFTEDRETMRLVLGELKKQNLFFIDSLTSSQTIAMEEAQEMGIPSARRDVFLDNDHDDKKICSQLEQLISLAKKKGWAIGIGHPNQATLTALTNCREHLVAQVEVVGIHQLVNPPSAQ